MDRHAARSMGTMPNSTQADGDGEQRSANDEFMDQWADPDDDYGDDEPRHQRTPGLLPGALIGAGIASLCAIGIYLLAGGGGSDTGTSPQIVTETQLGPTQTVTQDGGSDPADDSTFTQTTTVTPPPRTVTVRVVQPGKDTTQTKTLTTTATKTETSTVTGSAPPPETTTVTQTVTKTVSPPRPSIGSLRLP
jgi:hypothetical protein